MRIACLRMRIAPSLTRPRARRLFRQLLAACANRFPGVMWAPFCRFFSLRVSFKTCSLPPSLPRLIASLSFHPALTRPAPSLLLPLRLCSVVSPPG
eukprot:6214491-Pleurochrysis_carterae.AAC.1